MVYDERMKKNILKSFPYISVGYAMAILSNPLLYLALAVTSIDIQNLFGASLDRTTAGFDTHMPIIQAMSFVSIVGVVLIAIGFFIRKKK